MCKRYRNTQLEDIVAPAKRQRGKYSTRRHCLDWAQQVRAVVDAPRYAQAERITLVSDQLNTHRLASLYEAFAPEEARRLARTLESVHTPKHGRWLTMAEPDWQFRTADARMKLKYLYPKIEE